jgi:hypothetical protein
MTLDLDRPATRPDSPEGDRRRAGDRGAGDYRCLECGYGIVTLGLMPACPMCHGSDWQAARASPFNVRPSPASTEH